MKVTITPNKFNGKISAIASKSIAHRLLICAAFSDGQTQIRCENLNNDILATVDCLKSLGADITYAEKHFNVIPVKNIPSSPVLDCKESGSTLRFLLPVVCAITNSATFIMSGRLPERPLSPLKEELEAHGIQFSYKSKNEFAVNGKLSSGNYSIRGNVSSQFISGLLFALSLLDGNSILEVTENIESAPYIDMTLDALKQFGVDIEGREQRFLINSNKYTTKSKLEVEGDWSNAAFMLCAAALGSDVEVDNLNINSKQGDKKIISILESFGANVNISETSIRINGSNLKATEIDATNIPDLVPVIATVATVASGTTKIYGASRLVLKESNRLFTTFDMLSSLGADVELVDDGLIIHGKEKLSGGIVSSHSDHRIAMSAAIASIICQNDVTILDAEAVNKSYPDFWNDVTALGANVKFYE